MHYYVPAINSVLSEEIFNDMAEQGYLNKVEVETAYQVDATLFKSFKNQVFKAAGKTELVEPKKDIRSTASIDTKAKAIGYRITEDGSNYTLSEQQFQEWMAKNPQSDSAIVVDTVEYETNGDIKRVQHLTTILPKAGTKQASKQAAKVIAKPAQVTIDTKAEPIAVQVVKEVAKIDAPKMKPMKLAELKQAVHKILATTDTKGVKAKLKSRFNYEPTEALSKTTTWQAIYDMLTADTAPTPQNVMIAERAKDVAYETRVRKMTLTQLKEEAKNRDFTGISKLKKAELVTLLLGNN